MSKVDFREFTLAGKVLGWISAAVGGSIGCLCLYYLRTASSPPTDSCAVYFAATFLLPAFATFGLGYLILTAHGIKIYKSKEQLAEEQTKKISILGVLIKAIAIIFLFVMAIILLFVIYGYVLI